MGPRLPELWNAKLLKSSQKKALLRSLIDKVVDPSAGSRSSADARRGGVVARRPAKSFALRLATGLVVRRGGDGVNHRTDGPRGHSDTIHRHASHGRRTSCRRAPTRCLRVRSATLRLRKGLLRRAHQSHPRRVVGFLTVPQLAKKLGISWGRGWGGHDSDRINNGTL